MATVVKAKDLDRLEEMYYANHDTTLVTYIEFLKANTHLLSKDLLESGDEVNIVPSVAGGKGVSVQRRVTLW